MNLLMACCLLLWDEPQPAIDISFDSFLANAVHAAEEAAPVAVEKRKPKPQPAPSPDDNVDRPLVKPHKPAPKPDDHHIKPEPDPNFTPTPIPKPTPKPAPEPERPHTPDHDKRPKPDPAPVFPGIDFGPLIDDVIGRVETLVAANMRPVGWMVAMLTIGILALGVQLTLVLLDLRQIKASLSRRGGDQS